MTNVVTLSLPVSTARQVRTFAEEAAGALAEPAISLVPATKSRILRDVTTSVAGHYQDPALVYLYVRIPAEERRTLQNCQNQHACGRAADLQTLWKASGVRGGFCFWSEAEG